MVAGSARRKMADRDQSTPLAMVCSNDEVAPSNRNDNASNTNGDNCNLMPNSECDVATNVVDGYMDLFDSPQDLDASSECV